MSKMFCGDLVCMSCSRLLSSKAKLRVVFQGSGSARGFGSRLSHTRAARADPHLQGEGGANHHASQGQQILINQYVVKRCKTKTQTLYLTSNKHYNMARSASLDRKPYSPP